jgi:hypothetical protein
MAGIAHADAPRVGPVAGSLACSLFYLEWEDI